MDFDPASTLASAFLLPTVAQNDVTPSDGQGEPSSPSASGVGDFGGSSSGAGGISFKSSVHSEAGSLGNGWTASTSNSGYTFYPPSDFDSEVATLINSECAAASPPRHEELFYSFSNSEESMAGGDDVQFTPILTDVDDPLRGIL